MKIGLVGVGHWGQYILRDLIDLGAEVHTVARSPESIERANKGGASSIVSATELLPECDGYIVANRTISHLDAIEVLLKRSKPIYCEKPLSNDLERIKRLSNSAETLLFIMHKWRYHPGVVALKEIAASGEFGPVIGLRTFRLGWEHHHTDVNSIWILLPHDLSIIFHILNEVPKLHAAYCDPLSFSRDGVLAILSAQNGTINITSEVSSGHPNKFRGVVMACRDATCYLSDTDYKEITIYTRSATGNSKSPVSVERRHVEDSMPLYNELEAFLGYIKGGHSPMTAFSDEVKIIELISEIEHTIRKQPCALRS